MNDESEQTGWSLIARAISDMRRLGLSDYDIGHSLIKAGVTHLQDEHAHHGKLSELPEQLQAARKFIDRQLERLVSTAPQSMTSH